MAFSNFLPTVWTENLYQALDKQYIAVAHCNREYEGDIKEKGSRVRICGVGPVNVMDYVKGSDITAPQSLSENFRDLNIDVAKYFNFQIDDIDKAQTTPAIMESALKNAASALANEADSYIYKLYDDAGLNLTELETTQNNIISLLIDARTLLFKNNVADPQDIIFEVSPEIGSLILKAKINLTTDNTDCLENGCIGSIGGCKIYVSNNIQIVDSPEGTRHKCLARTKRAIAFAEQISEVIAYRPDNRFADAVKGLHLYGAKVVYPSEMVLMDFCPRYNY